MTDKNRKLREMFEALSYDMLIIHAEMFWEIKDPEGYKQEDLIEMIVEKAAEL